MGGISISFFCYLCDTITQNINENYEMYENTMKIGKVSFDETVKNFV